MHNFSAYVYNFSGQIVFHRHRMGNAGNGFPLPRRDGGEERARRDKQNFVQPARRHLVQDVRTEHHRTSTRAAAALKLVLGVRVDHGAAIVVIGKDVRPLFPQQILDDAAAQNAQIAR